MRRTKTYNLFILPLILTACGLDAPQTDTKPTIEVSSTPTPTIDAPEPTSSAWSEPELMACVEETYQAVSQAGFQRVQTPHYDLRFSGTPGQAEDAAGQLEALHQVMQGYFGAPPTPWAPLEVTLFANEGDFIAAIAADGEAAPPGAGGYYSYVTERAYAWVQPTEYFTRTLLLHEAIHQYHLKLHQGPHQVDWYVEGIAEWLSRHHWNEGCLQAGARPLLARDDIYEQALFTAEDGQLDLRSLIEGGQWNRPRAFAAIAGLARSPDLDVRARFETFRAEMDAGLDTPWARYRQLFGTEDELEDDILAWAEQDQMPMFPVYLEFYPIDETTVRAWAPFSTSSVIKEPFETLRVTLPTDDPEGYAGVTIAFDNPNNYTLLFVHGSGEVSTFDVVNNQVIWENLTQLGPQPSTVELVWNPANEQLTIEGQDVALPVLHHPVAGGLALYGTDGRFENIRIER